MRQTRNSRSLGHNNKTSRVIAHWIARREKFGNRIATGDCETKDKDREDIVGDYPVGDTSCCMRESDSLAFSFVGGDADDFRAGVGEDGDSAAVPDGGQVT
jgi:hypothetical protein